jgi:hypothetical protein
MTRHRLFRASGLAVASVGIVASLVAGAEHAAALSPSSPQGQALLASSVSKTVLIDTASGAITAVYLGQPPAAARHDQALFTSWIAGQQ